MTAVHAFLPPSGADAWVHCALWPAMNAAFPGGSTEKSEEGEAAHWVVAERTWGVLHAVGDRAPNGVVVTQEMLDGANLWLKAITPVLGQELHVEERLAPSRYSPDNWGTPDLWTLKGNALDVFDYKFGHGYVPVDTMQLVNYAGIIIEHHVADDRALQVRLHVVQPRCYDAKPHRMRTIQGSDLRAPVNILQNAAAEAFKSEPKARTGAHCKHCPGRHACSALQRDGFASMDEAFRTTPQELPPAAMAVEMQLVERALERLQARATGLREQCLGLVRQGQLPGWTLERGRGTEKWTSAPAEVLAVGTALGINLSKPAAPVTPGQAREAGVPAELVAAMSTTTAGPEKLTPLPSLATIFPF